MHHFSLRKTINEAVRIILVFLRLDIKNDRIGHAIKTRFWYLLGAVILIEKTSLLAPHNKYTRRLELLYQTSTLTGYLTHEVF